MAARRRDGECSLVLPIIVARSSAGYVVVGEETLPLMLLIDSGASDSFIDENLACEAEKFNVTVKTPSCQRFSLNQLII